MSKKNIDDLPEELKIFIKNLNLGKNPFEKKDDIISEILSIFNLEEQFSPPREPSREEPAKNKEEVKNSSAPSPIVKKEKEKEKENLEDLFVKNISISGDKRFFYQEKNEELIIFIPLLGHSEITLTVDKNKLQFLVETKEIEMKAIPGYFDTFSFTDLVSFEVSDISIYDFGKAISEKNNTGFYLSIPIKKDVFISRRIF